MNWDTSRHFYGGGGKLNLTIFKFLSLGAPHDGSGVAVNCSTQTNYLMTPSVGYYADNIQNLFLFSNCSINAFKTKLLTADRLYE